MEREVHIGLIPTLPDIEPALLLVSFGTANLVFQVDKPGQLAKWLAFLFKHRDQPHPSSAAVTLEVGRFGPNPVEFSIEGEDMMLVTGIADQPNLIAMAGTLETVLGKPSEIVPSLTIYIPRELLDDLADGLAREHRQWVELLSSSKGASGN
jgi:hypothetical protein